jgi:hypothetical protein
MNAKRPRLGWWLAGGLAIAGAGVLGLQRGERRLLQTEIEVLRFDVQDLGRLERENRRRRERQVPAAELEKLRADHAALPRLRAEIEALQERAKATGR